MSGRWTGVGAHRTRTIEWSTGRRQYKTKSNGSCGRWVESLAAKAECVCGWEQAAASRTEAQGLARVHRAQLPVPTADLAAFVATLCDHPLPGDLRAALRRVEEAVAAAAAATIEVFLVDLVPLLQWANRPYLYPDQPHVPRLIAAVESIPAHKVGMLASVSAYCDLVARTHGLPYPEWLRQVTTDALRAGTAMVGDAAPPTTS